MTVSELPAWRLIERAAIKLTQAGRTPFAPKDIVEHVQQANPRYGRNSINPVIASLTDNAEDAVDAPGGRHILHRVGRGRYELLHDAHEAALGPQSPTLRVPTSQPIGGREFHYMGELLPERDPTGRPRALYPHQRFSNRRGLALHRFGHGPFARISLPELPSTAGVYVICSDEDVAAIEACEDLNQHINKRVGIITPRNCYRGGSEGDCWTNAWILKAAQTGSQVTLWFYESAEPQTEAEALRAEVDVVWPTTPPSRDSLKAPSPGA